MSEYINRQEAIKIADSYSSEDAMDIREEITLLPIADAVEVVRCKDCRHGKMRDYAPSPYKWYCTISVNYHSRDFFCACGERREK